MGLDLEQNFQLSRECSAVILDVASPEDSRRAALLLNDFSRHTPVWILDHTAGVVSAVAWIKSGAAEVFTDIPTLRAAIANHQTPANFPSSGNLVGETPAMHAVSANIRLVAARKCTVLIEGETGTGKEVVAREIHNSGGRSRGPWVAVNCSAIPDTLLEAELFGYTRGAFTGAVQPRAGKFEAANHGTIFLDEIGDMPLAIQAKLLRVLQEREVERLGGNERIRLDVRVIAATNRNLAARVAAGLFRADLYYRLNVFQISLPPLRERPGDIPLLAQHFVARACAAENLRPKRIDPAALDRLAAHLWPGNARELENVIETAVILSGDRPTVQLSDLRLTRPAPTSQACAAPFSIPAGGLDYQTTLESLEHDLLTEALKRTRGNKTAAAELLRLKRTTLAARIRVLESRQPRLVA